MKLYSHLSVSIGVGTFWISWWALFFPILKFMVVFFMIVFGFLGYICDGLDFYLYSRHERRFLTHSPFSPLLIFIVIIIAFFFGVFLHPGYGLLLGIISYITVVSHILLDYCNPSGIPLTPKKKIHMARPVRYDNFGYNVIFFGLGVVLTGMGIMIMGII